MLGDCSVITGGEVDAALNRFAAELLPGGAASLQLLLHVGAPRRLPRCSAASAKLFLGEAMPADRPCVHLS